MTPRPSLESTPKEGWGGCRPKLMKLRVASEKMARGTVRVMLTRMGPRVLGMMCFFKM